MISCAVMKMRTAALNRSTSNAPSAVLNFIKLSEARLQAVLLRKRYSLHGFLEFCPSVPFHVCHLLMVRSNCLSGSPQNHLAPADFRNSPPPCFFSHPFPSVSLC